MNLSHHRVHVCQPAKLDNTTRTTTSIYQLNSQLECEHLFDEFKAHIILRKGSHDLAIVFLDQSGQRGDCAWNFRLRNKRHEAEHRQATIVDFDVQLSGLLLFRKFLCQAEGIEKIQWHWMWDLFKCWEIAWLATLHVMRLAIRLQYISTLGPELKEANDDKDLELAWSWNRIPNCWC